MRINCRFGTRSFGFSASILIIINQLTSTSGMVMQAWKLVLSGRVRSSEPPLATWGECLEVGFQHRAMLSSWAVRKTDPFSTWCYPHRSPLKLCSQSDSVSHYVGHQDISILVLYRDTDLCVLTAGFSHSPALDQSHPHSYTLYITSFSL